MKFIRGGIARRIIPQSLRTRLMLVQAIVSVCIFALIGVAIYNFTRNREDETWRGRQSEAARNAAQTIGIVVEEAYDALNWVGSLEAGYLQANPDTLTALLKREEFLSEVIRVDAAGRLVASTHPDLVILGNLFTVPQSTWFRQARQGDAYLSTVQVSLQNLPYLIVALPAPNNHVVAARLKIDVLWHEVDDIHFGQSGRVYVVNQDGLIISHTDKTIVTSQLNIAERPEFIAMMQSPQNEWRDTYVNLQGFNVVGATARIPKTDWIAFTEISQDEAFASSRAALLFLIGGMFIFLLIGILITRHSFDVQIVRPLDQLRQGALRIGKGDLSHRITLDSPTEIKHLADAFNEMAAQLLGHETEIRTYTEQLRQAKTDLEMRVQERTTELTTARARLQYLLATSPVVIYSSKADGDYGGTFVSENIENMMGYTTDQFTQQSDFWFTRIHTDDRQRVMNELASLVAAGENVSEYRFLDANGSYRWVRDATRLIRDEDGKPKEIVGAWVDITEKKRAEEALNKSEKLFRGVIEQANDGIMIADAQGTIVEWNHGQEQITGIPREVALGRPIWEIQFRSAPDEYRQIPETYARNRQQILDFLVDPSSPWANRLVEQEIQRLDKTRVIVQSIAFHIKTETGLFIGSVMRDITERKRVEDELRKLSRAVEHSPVSIVITDTDGVIEYVNPKFTQVTGYMLEEAIGNNPRILKSGQTPLEVYDELWHNLAQGVEWHGEFVNRKKNGELYYESASISPITDAHNKTTHYVAVKDDITDRKRNEQALAKHAKEMEMLYTTSLEVSAQTDLPAVLQTIIHRATELIGGDLGSLHLLNDDHQTLRLVVGHNLPNVSMIGNTQKLGQGVAGQVVQNGRIIVVTDYARSEYRARPYSEMQIQRLLGVPLQVQGKVIGAIVIANHLKSETFTEEELHLVRLFADQAALVVDRARLYDDIQRLAITDELTQIYNRRGLFQFGEREVERALRFNHPLAAVMFDIDRFKTVNDTYSHAIGDKVLQAVAQAAQHNARRLDLLGRYGGEEFVWLIPEADLASAASAAERLRQSIEEIEFPINGHTIRVTISLGIAQVTKRTLDLATLIDQADLAMLRAKESGRNRVATSD